MPQSIFQHDRDQQRRGLGAIDGGTQSGGEQFRQAPDMVDMGVGQQYGSHASQCNIQTSRPHLTLKLTAIDQQAVTP